MNNSESGDDQIVEKVRKEFQANDKQVWKVEKEGKRSNEATMRASITNSLMSRNIDAKTAGIMAANQVAKMMAGKEDVGASAADVEKVIKASDQPGGED